MKDQSFHQLSHAPDAATLRFGIPRFVHDFSDMRISHYRRRIIKAVNRFQRMAGIFKFYAIPVTHESYRRFLVTAERSGGGGCGLTVGRLGDDLDPVGEFHTLNDLWQLVVAVEPAPAFLRAVDQLEDHGERGPVREAALRADRAVAHGGEGAFDGVRRAQVFPVLGREVVERQQRVAILAQAFGGLRRI